MGRRLKCKHRAPPAAPVANLRKVIRSGPWICGDGLATGRVLRIYTLVDSFTRECLALGVDS